MNVQPSRTTTGATEPDRSARARLRLVEQPSPHAADMCADTVVLYAAVHRLDVPAEQRIAAVRDALAHTVRLHGGLPALPPDDGVALSYVEEAIGQESKVAEAIDRVGVLAEHEQSSFGARLAGALYDIETLDREERHVAATIAAAEADPNLGVWDVFPKRI